MGDVDVSLIDRVYQTSHYMEFAVNLMRAPHRRDEGGMNQSLKVNTSNMLTLGSKFARALYHEDKFPQHSSLLLQYCLRIETLHDMIAMDTYLSHPGYLLLSKKWAMSFREELVKEAVRREQCPPLAPVPEVRAEASILRKKRVYRKRKTQVEKLIEDALSTRQFSEDKRFRSVMRQISPKQ